MTRWTEDPTVRRAHASLVDLYETGEFATPEALALAFHAWARETGHNTAIEELRAVHILSGTPMDARYAALVLEWLDGRAPREEERG